MKRIFLEVIGTIGAILIISLSVSKCIEAQEKLRGEKMQIDLINQYNVEGKTDLVIKEAEEYLKLDPNNA